jgi:hypothetical protein
MRRPPKITVSQSAFWENRVFDPKNSQKGLKTAILGLFRKMAILAGI